MKNIPLFFGGCIIAILLLWIGQAGCAGIVFLIGATLALLPKKFTTGELVNRPYVHEWTRAEIEDDLEQLYKDMTGNYSAAELQEMEQEERDNYNNNISSASWWAGSDTYVDHDGVTRRIDE